MFWSISHHTKRFRSLLFLLLPWDMWGLTPLLLCKFYVFNVVISLTVVLTVFINRREIICDYHPSSTVRTVSRVFDTIIPQFLASGLVFYLLHIKHLQVQISHLLCLLSSSPCFVHISNITASFCWFTMIITWYWIFFHFLNNFQIWKKMTA